MTRPTRWRRARALAAAGLTALVAAGLTVMPADAVQYARISGNGSSWAGNAVNQWLADVKAQGVTVDYTNDGSSSGRKNFAIGLSDYAVSEIPFKGDTADKQDNNFPDFSYKMLPVVAGGTSFMYNLSVNGRRYTSLKLTQRAIAKIFSGQVTRWNDPVIAASNPGVNLPNQRITVVVRSDGSGATAQFTLWMKHEFPSDYKALCSKTGCNPSAATSYFPYQGLSNFTAQSQSNGVTTYTANTPYTINYDEYSYALGVDFPVARVQNAAGFYTVPTDTAVAVALTKAKINSDRSSLNYLSQDLSAVYSYKDPRTYPISAYSYEIVPSKTHDNFNQSKGATLAYFSTYALCEGQRRMGALGYSPLPMNLVLAAMDQVEAIPGIDSDTSEVIRNTRKGVASGTSNPCNNPTFKAGDSPSHNVLIDTAPFPAGCDSACQAPWTGKSAGNNNGPGGTSGGTDGSKNSGGTKAGSTTGGTTTTGSTGTTTGQVACDPDTGQCGTVGGTTGTASGTALVATPQVIAGSEVWGIRQLAIALSVLFLAGLAVGPPLISSALDRRRSTPAPAVPPTANAEPEEK